MKKITSLIMVAAILTSLFTFSVSAQENVSVYIDGKKIEFDVQPQIIEGRTLVPMRKIFEELGAEVTWDNDISTATAIKDNYSVSITIGSDNMYKNDDAIYLDVPAKIIGGRTLVPVRAIAESFSCNVTWNSERRTIEIERPFNDSQSELSAFEKLRDFLIKNGEYDPNRGYFITQKSIYKETHFTNLYDHTTEMIYLFIKYYDFYITLMFFNDESSDVDNDKYYAAILLGDSDPWLFKITKTTILWSLVDSGDLDLKLADLCEEYKVNGSSTQFDFAPIIKGIMEHSQFLWESKGLVLDPYELIHPPNDDDEIPTATIYNNSGESKTIYSSQVNAYLNNGWYNTLTEVIYEMYMKESLEYYEKGLYYEAVDTIKQFCAFHWNKLSKEQQENVMLHLIDAENKLADYLLETGINYYNNDLFFEAKSYLENAIVYYKETGNSKLKEARDYLVITNGHIKKETCKKCSGDGTYCFMCSAMLPVFSEKLMDDYSDHLKNHEYYKETCSECGGTGVVWVVN